MSEDELKAIQFRECASCAAKPGSPSLCDACLANRAAVGALVAEVRRLRGLIKANDDRRRRNGDACDFCGFEPDTVDDKGHAFDCPAFTPDGDVR